MATRNELIKGYIERIRKASDKDLELSKIINEIRSLYYEGTSKNISREDIDDLLKKLSLGLERIYTFKQRRSNEQMGGTPIGHKQAYDDSDFNDLILEAIKENER